MKLRDHGVEGQVARSARVSPSQQTQVREDLLDDGLIPNRCDTLEFAAKLAAVSYGSWPRVDGGDIADPREYLADCEHRSATPIRPMGRSAQRNKGGGRAQPGRGTFAEESAPSA